MKLPALAVSLLALSVASLAASGPAEGLSVPQTYPVIVRCDTCEPTARPILGVSWSQEGKDELVQATLEAADWASGLFTMQLGGVKQELQGVPAEGGGYTLAVPVGDKGLPFRIIGVLPGSMAPHAAHWPQRDGGISVFEFRKMADVLADHPTWDPARTTECDLIVPKSAKFPVTFQTGAKPRAWLFPTPGHDTATDGEGAWTFQFVTPGSCLLERVAVKLDAGDEGDSWSFALPLASVLSEQLALETGKRDAGAPLQLSGLGAVDLADCPRSPRR